MLTHAIAIDVRVGSLTVRVAFDCGIAQSIEEFTCSRELVSLSGFAAGLFAAVRLINGALARPDVAGAAALMPAFARSEAEDLCAQILSAISKFEQGEVL